MMIGEQLAFARRERGYSLEKLSKKLFKYNKELAVNSQTINKYEKNIIIPPSDTLDALKNILDIDDHFLFNVPDVQIQSIDFRKSYGLNKEQKDKMRNIIITIAGYVTSEYNIEKKKYTYMESMDTLVKEIKDDTNIPDNMPIQSTIQTIWNLGQNTWVLDSDNLDSNVDGLKADYTYENNQKNSIILINKNNKSLERERFTTMHELAHSIIDFPEDMSHKDLEQKCNQFASAFLMPKDIVLKEFDVSIRELPKKIYTFKKIYGVSAASVLMRLANLEIISFNTMRWAFMSFAKTWRTEEPNPINSNDWEKIPSDLKKLADKSLQEGKITQKFYDQLVLD